MRCKLVRNKLEVFIDDDLDQVSKLAIIKHLNSCKKCESFYNRRLSLGGQLTTLLHQSTSPLKPPIAKFPTKTTGEPSWHKIVFSGKRLVYATLLLFIAVIGFYLIQITSYDPNGNRSSKISRTHKDSYLTLTAITFNDKNEWISKKHYIKRLNDKSHSMELTLKKTRL